jgi:hypothetical protein
MKKTKKIRKSIAILPLSLAALDTGAALAALAYQITKDAHTAPPCDSKHYK